jgi:H+-translocating NAD(P) transhydrogenase subunit alpha
MDVDPTVFRLAIFVLAIFVGYYVVWSVTPALHTPLMAVTNAVSSVIIVGALLAAAAQGAPGAGTGAAMISKGAGALRRCAGGGEYLRRLPGHPEDAGHVQEERAGQEGCRQVNANLAAILYLVSGVLFILALRGLSSPVTSQAGNRNGMIGMALAVGVTTLSPSSARTSWTA